MKFIVKVKSEQNIIYARPATCNIIDSDLALSCIN